MKVSYLPRRKFIKDSSTFLAASGIIGLSCAPKTSSVNTINSDDMFFKISLAQWSLNKAFFGGDLDHLDFAAKTKSFDIHAIEYVNQFFKFKAEDTTYLNQMNQRAADNGVKQLLIMIDGEGGLGSVQDAERKTAVENHYKWVNAAKYLGCHAIRVNAYGEGSAEDVGKAATDGLARLSEYAMKEDISVIVENHGGFSSNGQWLSNVIKNTGMKNCGTLPDFGNFCIKRDKDNWRNCLEAYDKYKGVEEMMPYAKAVSAKAHEFDADGNEPEIDFMRIMKIVKAHGYTGYVGIEYEGQDLSADDGIRATRDLLIKVGKALS